MLDQSAQAQAPVMHGVHLRNWPLCSFRDILCHSPPEQISPSVSAEPYIAIYFNFTLLFAKGRGEGKDSQAANTSLCLLSPSVVKSSISLFLHPDHSPMSYSTTALQKGSLQSSWLMGWQRGWVAFLHDGVMLLGCHFHWGTCLHVLDRFMF